ncbi:MULTISPECIES: hypothetical protein [Chryseobacterium]|uniref:Uncharacterized protein n=2 Tax=Chryseobacterium aquaticum TaxID=452084 RepID=A0A101CIV1_9FLAO|nr:MULTISPECIES: hypothetical protein [Chryseobacterium]KUJ57042.1 hypothetical protein AR686_05075 [Chryseobacterium aquaticum subsp. greenlandense]NMR35661.1 hypothetical protein [Chryseobacterium aquaticum]NRQ47736.1 hypothetical protein [Chryseobacterium sp. C-204]
MDSTIEILKGKIESLTPELAEAFIRIIDNMDTTSTSAIPQFQLDEVFDRIQFHNENPSTKLDFFENISEFEKICA